MRIILASAWHPRGELRRFENLLPVLRQVYASMVISLPPDVSPNLAGQLGGLPEVQAIVTSDWAEGRYSAVQRAYAAGAECIHYVDFDRLLRWAETRQEEWRRIALAGAECDCLIVGRSEAAYATHPDTLRRTERISNHVVSELVGQAMDVSAGSKAFSRRAAGFLLANCSPGHALGTDGEWPVILHRAGFRIDYLEADGLDWESADREQDQAADALRQREHAAAYDADPQHWARRADVAMEVTEQAFKARLRPLVEAESPASPAGRLPVFDFDAVFEADDYLYFYQESLTDKRSDREVELLVQAAELQEPQKILDLACGFGRHAIRLAALGHRVTGLDLTAGFLELARKQAAEQGVKVNFRQGDMRSLEYRAEFDRVLLLFTAFGYFNDEENALVLRNIARALKPGGLLAFDIPNRDTFWRGMQPCQVVERGADLMIDRHSYDTQTGRWYNRRLVIRNGLRKDKPFSIRLYNPTEIRLLLEQAGLEIHTIYGGWDGVPLNADSRRMVIIARKTADA